MKLLPRRNSHNIVTEQWLLPLQDYSGKICGELLGTAPSMATVFQMILRVSQSQEPVLILGETGTGKELVARAIHQIGPLRDKSFLPIDCSALVPGLIETELFGYDRGAFTGATNSKIGLFEAGRGGTVFLDEIGDIPVGLQSKVLRALQEGEIRPVGSTRWVEFDARVIAATNQDLESAMEQGSFRKDLYYRLNVFTIMLPALRERKEDIPLLANYFLAKCSRGQEEPPQISGLALDCLMAYDWPGNVRELENCMRWTAAWSPGPVADADDLPPQVRKPGKAAPVADLCGEQVISLEEMERRAIMRALATANGDKLIAARILGIGKTTIYRKLREYAIS